MQFAAKECSKKMARRREADWLKVKRLARYLVGNMRMIQQFAWQDTPDSLRTFTDSDRAARKSTSGGAITS